MWLPSEAASVSEAFPPKAHGGRRCFGAPAYRHRRHFEGLRRPRDIERRELVDSTRRVGRPAWPLGFRQDHLLRVIAGLETPDDGALRLGGDDATGLSVQDRRAGFVFQSYALFRHMTVFDNIAYGLKVRPRRSRPGRREIARRVNDLLDMVQLPGLGGRYPTQLSGGQRQRVALARSLAIEPRVLLLDEPFGALDAKVRKDLRQWLREIHDRTALTTVFVTHDQNEAMELADRVAILNEGRIEQLATASEIRQRPATAFIREFLS
jgi:sulfate/thiosulfate transport system ATP-binding protein